MRDITWHNFAPVTSTHLTLELDNLRTVALDGERRPVKAVDAIGLNSTWPGMVKRHCYIVDLYLYLEHP